ncbi:MAG: acetyl-CoA C-acetyltransferase [Chitinophagales bacterium]|nr:acetyl-CoA C-acetyltransferase [Chitinophagales bacterium]MCZ2393482.1 acetyl-CoA C-acetyltransferase [Chitinophagales bacterium]
MNEAYIFDAIRTPRGKGKKNGSLHEVTPINLVAGLLKSMQERNGFNTKEVEDVILGCVTPVGDQGGNIAKIAALHAGWDDSVSGFQLNRFCASGLEAINLAAAKVRSGWHDMIVAGGVESMSRIPMGSDGGPWFLDPSVSFNTHFVPQGISADLIATLEGFSREELDKYALRSQKRAAAAKAAGYFKNSVIPVKDINGLVILEEDEFNRPDTTLEGLLSLSPSFAMPGEMGFDAVALQRYPQLSTINHVHHPGNSSGIVDGAALVLIGSKEKGASLGLKPRARIRMAAHTSTEPTIMLTGPGPASLLALKKAGMTIHDIDLVEMNEAFASAVLKLQRDINCPDEKLNVNGGAIALGHPLGATGAMILGTALDELERTGKATALITLCVGGGMGVTTIIERV